MNAFDRKLLATQNFWDWSGNSRPLAGVATATRIMSASIHLCFVSFSFYLLVVFR